MAYLLDADWAIDALRKRPGPASELHVLSPNGIAVSRVTRAEMYEGAYGSVDPQAALIPIRSFLSAFRVLEITDPIVEGFAEMRAFLARRGTRIADFDLLVAATALHHDLTLLTFNRQHFARVPELRIYEPDRQRFKR